MSISAVLRFGRRHRSAQAVCAGVGAALVLTVTMPGPPHARAADTPSSAAGTSSTAGQKQAGQASAGSQASSSRSYGNGALGTQASGMQASGNGALGTQASGMQASGNGALGTQASGTRASGNGALGTQASGTRASGSGALGTQASGMRASGNGALGTQASGKQGSAGSGGAATKPGEKPGSGKTPKAREKARVEKALARTDKRLADLKRSLGITESETNSWHAFAEVARDHAKALARMRAKRAEDLPHMNAVKNIESYAAITAREADDMNALSAAFATLYGKLTKSQQGAADELFRQEAEKQARIRLGLGHP